MDINELEKRGLRRNKMSFKRCVEQITSQMKLIIKAKEKMADLKTEFVLLSDVIKINKKNRKK